MLPPPRCCCCSRRIYKRRLLKRFRQHLTQQQKKICHCLFPFPLSSSAFNLLSSIHSFHFLNPPHREIWRLLSDILVRRKKKTKNKLREIFYEFLNVLLFFAKTDDSKTSPPIMFYLVFRIAGRFEELRQTSSILPNYRHHPTTINHPIINNNTLKSTSASQ